MNVNPCESPDREYARRTARGYSAFECLLGCLLVGAATGVPSGGWIAWTVSSSFGTPPVILFLPGTLFGLALWLISQLFVGNVTPSQVAIIIAGSVTGFVAAGSIYELMMAGPDPRPPWTWPRLRPFLIASGVAHVLIVVAVRSASGPTRLGAMAMLLAYQPRAFGPGGLAIVEGIPVAVFQTALLGLIGFQLALSRRQSAGPHAAKSPDHRTPAV